MAEDKEESKVSEDVKENIDKYNDFKNKADEINKGVNSYIGKNVINGFSITRRGRNSIFYFPVYCSKSLTVNEAHAIAKMFERVYADFVQNALAQEKRIIDADELTGMKFLNKFHTNLIDESTDSVSRYFGSEPLDRLDEIIYSSCHNILETYDGYMISYGCKDNTSIDYVSEHENNLHEFFQGLSYLQETKEKEKNINEAAAEEEKTLKEIAVLSQEMQSLRRLQEKEIEEINKSNLNEFINKDNIDDDKLEEKIKVRLKDSDLELYKQYDETKKSYEKQIEMINDIAENVSKIKIDNDKLDISFTRNEEKKRNDLNQDTFNYLVKAINNASDSGNKNFDPKAEFIKNKYNKEDDKDFKLTTFSVDIISSFVKSDTFKKQFLDKDGKVKPEVSHNGGTAIPSVAFPKALEEYIKNEYATNKTKYFNNQIESTQNMKGAKIVSNKIDDAKNKIKQYNDTEKKINELSKKIDTSINKFGNVAGRTKLKEIMTQGETRTYEELRKLALSAGSKPVTILKDTDIKKINGMLPYNVNIEMWIKPSSKERANWDGNYRALTIQVGIKTVLHLIDPKDLDDEVEDIIQGSKKRFDNIRFQTGEMNWIQYIFKSKENKEALKKARTNKNKRWINTLKKLGKYRDTYGGLFKPLLPILTGFKKTDAPIPNASMVLTAIDVDNLKYSTGIDFNKVSTVNKFASQMFLITFIIVDSSTRTIKTLYPGESSDWDIVSLDSVEDLLAKSSNIDFMREIKKSINR